MKLREVTCPECGGFGFVDEEEQRKCPTCHGDGLVDDWETTEEEG